jgi:hypothetical protein
VVVGLQWSAVTGAATYNISRNGSSIETGTSLLAYNLNYARTWSPPAVDAE